MKLSTLSSIAVAIAFLSCSCSGDKTKTDASSEEVVAEETAVVEDTDTTINGHEFVDLGLPSGLKWATLNIGASKPEQYGEFFAWGETSPKTSYTEENCATFNKDNAWLLSNGYIDESGKLTSEHDAACQNWGGTWRMPTEKDIEELAQNTTCEKLSEGFANGMLLTSKINGNTIFLPDAGWMEKAVNMSANEICCYWGSTTEDKYPDQAVCICSDNKVVLPGFSVRYLGRPIRPVSD